MQAPRLLLAGMGNLPPQSQAARNKNALPSTCAPPQALDQLLTYAPQHSLHLVSSCVQQRPQGSKVPTLHKNGDDHQLVARSSAFALNDANAARSWNGHRCRDAVPDVFASSAKERSFVAIGWENVPVAKSQVTFVIGGSVVLTACTNKPSETCGRTTKSQKQKARGALVGMGNLPPPPPATKR